MAEMPKAVAHLHSNGEFCQDSHVVSDEWPVYLWTAEQVAELMERAVASLYGNAIEEFKATYCK